MQVISSAGMLRLVRFEISTDEFPALLVRGIGIDGRLVRTEQLAQDLIAGGFHPTQSLAFVRAVCLWGRDPRRAGKVIANNSTEAISNALSMAHAQTSRDNIAEALQAITSLKGLAVSFGSKHLKFLDPERHVVLDSILSERLGYTRDNAGNGYLQWLSACREYLAIVQSAGIPYPGPGKSGWRVADIEMAIFVKIRSE